MPRDSAAAPRPPARPPERSGAGYAAAIAAACLVCVPLTAQFEGLRTKPYRDPVGIPTVCYGETNVAMRAYSTDECGRLLRDQLRRVYAPRVAACLPQLTRPERKHEFAALIDASYNAGPAAVCKSRMARAIVAGNWRAACDGLEGWYVTARGVRLPGLVRRRQAERRLCLAPEPISAPPRLMAIDYPSCVVVPTRPITPTRPVQPFKRKADNA